jgi:hypothetical protein
MGNSRFRVEDFDDPAFSVLLVEDGIPLVTWAIVGSIAFANVVPGDHVRGSKILFQLDRAEVTKSKRPFCDGVYERAPDATISVSHNVSHCKRKTGVWVLLDDAQPLL